MICRFLLVTGFACAVSAVTQAGEVSVRVNQLGYVPDGPKLATIITPSDVSLEFQLADSKNMPVLHRLFQGGVQPISSKS